MSEHAAVKKEHRKLYRSLLTEGDPEWRIQILADFAQDERLKEAEWSQQMFHRLPWSLDASLAKRIEKELRERIEKLKRGEL